MGRAALELEALCVDISSCTCKKGLVMPPLPILRIKPNIREGPLRAETPTRVFGLFSGREAFQLGQEKEHETRVRGPEVWLCDGASIFLPAQKWVLNGASPTKSCQSGL